MQVYLVGGAVRDYLLGHPYQEKRLCCGRCNAGTHARPRFSTCRQRFPVFLHPETKEEYALARTERKSGQGYHGFQFFTDTTVSLEDDLIRRDLTINAIAMDQDGKIYDPYGGQNDLENKILRHVSEAFAEDPLRYCESHVLPPDISHMVFKLRQRHCNLCKPWQIQVNLMH